MMYFVEKASAQGTDEGEGGNDFQSALT